MINNNSAANLEEDKKYTFSNTKIGGMVGGIVCFLVVYFTLTFVIIGVVEYNMIWEEGNAIVLDMTHYIDYEKTFAVMNIKYPNPSYKNVRYTVINDTNLLNTKIGNRIPIKIWL